MADAEEPQGGDQGGAGEEAEEPTEIISATTDLYAVLGVSCQASEDEIRAAYKKAAIKWHPDKNRHQEELANAKFREVTTAYAVLK